jgi:class 3 adenylate cyclase/tetratricopeptide (TPR) repeat protein
MIPRGLLKMKCPKCQFNNRKRVKFCEECGVKLEFECKKCGAQLPPGRKFCGVCGEKFEEGPQTGWPAPSIGSERKEVTALFSDLSGYAAMSEKLDPEELKDIMSRIFGEIAQVVTKYEGFIEKFIGDAVVALFGVLKAHEDDPIRAIRAARELHGLVEAMSPEFEKRIGQPLSMHTGINTGLVVTGRVDLEQGTHGASGDTINLASRLSSLAKRGEILVGPETFGRAEGYFTFDSLAPTKVKGKLGPVQAHKVLAPKERPVTVHRLSGLRADLIGRKVELARLEEALHRLREGKGTIFSICGEAGTGKSRLVEEFRTSVEGKEIQWLEGHAYAYSRNIPHFPIIDLLNRTWRIEEGDPSERVREKVELGIESLIGKKEEIVPYVGTLYALTYPEVENIDPAFLKSCLQKALQAILIALAQQKPTVICFEDIQWADPSTVDTLRSVLSSLNYPALVLCVFRPPFSLFTSHQLSGMANRYQEIRLQDLSPSESEDMVESLLNSKIIPQELRQFIHEKIEGNPFYVEEVINSLIESDVLSQLDESWCLTRSISQTDVPPTVQGVISARLDRLEVESKRILQEASVIGRAFLYVILEKITELKQHLGSCLDGLERVDLIRTRSLQPELEYIFKHAMTQEVVYNRLLKKDRQVLHERIARVMEQLFGDRLLEFYETLAFHFKKSEFHYKAVDYLVKSGEKSLNRYAVEEADRYFKEAFDLLTDKPDRTKADEQLLIDLLVKWAYAFYYRGDLKGLTDLLSTHRDLAESLGDETKLGMFYAWLGYALWGRERLRDSYEYLKKALKLGEKVGSEKVVGYACAWLSMTCAEMGLLEEAIAFGKRGQDIGRSLESDHCVYFLSLSGMGQAYWHTGEGKKALEAGKALLDYGEKYSNIRSLVTGHYSMGHGHFNMGDLQSAIECYQTAVQLSVDPYYSQFPKTMECYSLVSNGQFQEAKEAIQEILTFDQNFGVEIIGTPAHALLGLVTVAEGNFSRGMQMLEDTRQIFLEQERRSLYARSEYALGKVYLEIVEGAAPISPARMMKNIRFLVKNLPFASKKAEDHFKKSIEVSKEIGAKGVLGNAYFNLGLLYKVRGKKDQARESISKAVQFFEQCEAEEYVKQAKGALESLG